MDQAAALDAVPPLSPVSSRSEHSLAELESELATNALLIQTQYPAKPSRADNALLPALQVVNGDPDGLDPIAEDDLDPGSFDLVMPVEEETNTTAVSKHKLEQRSELLFSQHHLHAIFADSAHLHRFSNFLYKHRPASVPLLNYYLSALKALRAINYSNSVLRKLRPLRDFDVIHDFPKALPTANQDLQEQADRAFEILTREDLPAYITHVWIQTVSVSIRHRVMGTSSDASEGLAEVFCLTDPSRPDNPIVFMSEQFNRTTQYGVDYVIGRNCRFLQGPCTNPFSVKRIREKLEAGIEHYETFLNYRRDGSPFMNLVMLAPLYDSRGKIRYFIGAQVDVSGLAMSSYDLGALGDLVEENAELKADDNLRESEKDDLTQFAEILAPNELDVVSAHGGSMHRLPLQAASNLRPFEKVQMSRSKDEISNQNYGPSHNRHGSKNRIVIRDGDSQKSNSPVSKDDDIDAPQRSQATTAASLSLHHNGRLTGVYEHYLLVRPYPSLRILFTSPSMRVPGILQSPLLDRIGGSARMRDQLVQALSEGQGVTAKVKWLSSSRRNRTTRPSQKKTNFNHPLEAHLDADDDLDTVTETEPAGRSRWLHCTPLAGASNKVGVWMIVIVDDEEPRSRPQPQAVVARPIDAVPAHLQVRRPQTAVSDWSLPSAIDDGRDASHRESSLIYTRPRRSSETLGYQRADMHAPLPRDGSGGFVTQAIHNQYSPYAQQRSPRAFQNGIPASKFFSLDALSRAASSKVPKERPESRGSSGRSSISSISSMARAFPRPEPPLPPWPARSDSKSAPKVQAEGKARVVSMIPEEGRDRSRNGFRTRRDEDETSSLHSRASEFTVKIGEE